jgi:TetR/AcrR family transcriptional regulator, cholesterol catabolism regulator
MEENSSQKQAIADSFQKHFQHFGFKKTSVDDISTELHISKKTIYQYFSTKEEIFFYVVSQIAHQYLKKMENDLKQFPTNREKLVQLIHMVFGEAKKWLKENDAFEFKYKYEIAELAFKDAYSELMKKILEQGIEAGEFASAPVDLTVRMMQGMISESMRLVSANPDLAVEEYLTSAILKMIQ